jgi:hypothetical protein
VTGGGPPIAAERIVVAPPSEVFSFLADLENHWLLADRFVEVLSLERPPGGGPAHGGTVRIRGPLGLGRTARTRLVQAQPHTSVEGTASVGARTEARVHWTLTPVIEGTLVRLEATVERMGRSEAIVLAAGGRRWLEDRFASILNTLARRLEREAGQVSSA